MMMTKAEQRGYDAYLRGDDLTKNPYDAYTFDHKKGEYKHYSECKHYSEWVIGWKKGLAESKKALNQKREQEKSRVFVSAEIGPRVCKGPSLAKTKEAGRVDSGPLRRLRNHATKKKKQKCKKCGTEKNVKNVVMHLYNENGFVCWDCKEQGKTELLQAQIALAKRKGLM